MCVQNYSAGAAIMLGGATVDPKLCSAARPTSISSVAPPIIISITAPHRRALSQRQRCNSEQVPMQMWYKEQG